MPRVVMMEEAGPDAVIASATATSLDFCRYPSMILKKL
jgi:hypothetical protein